MFSTNTTQTLSAIQPVLDVSANNMSMKIDTMPQDVEVEENPAAKINVSFQCVGDLRKNEVEFSLHFKVQDVAPNTTAAANDLLNFLLTPDFTRGIFSESSRKNKFQKAKHSSYDTRLGYYFDPRSPKKMRV